MKRTKYNHGFTLAELLGVLVVLSLILTIAATNIFPMIMKSKKKAFVNDATIISEGAKTKYLDDKLANSYSEDLLNGAQSQVVCYNVNSIIGKYAKTDNKTLKGSVAVCKTGSCSLLVCSNASCGVLRSVSFDKTMIWLKNDRYVIDGKTYDSLTKNSVDSNLGDGGNFEAIYRACGRNDVQVGGDEDYFDYSGTEKTYTAPKTGTYEIHVWGAQGGHKDGYGQGYGGYAVGRVRLFQGDTIYINVGGKGLQYSGGYNGGGSGKYYAGTWGYGGGGATSVARVSGTLSTLQNNLEDILIVAGGGGGNGGIINSTYPGNSYGGNGGGYKGTTGSKDTTPAETNCSGIGATQTQGGATYLCGGSVAYPAGTFGQGAISYFGSANMKGGAGGGGGFYGGGGSSTGIAGGGGGSGYIGNIALFSKSMYCYKCDTATGRHQKTVSVTSASETPTEQVAKIGNGYLKIKYIGQFPMGDRYIYKNGVAYEYLGYKVTGATSTDPTFGTSSITLPSTGFSSVYTKPIDLSTYNTLIIRKSTPPVQGRVGVRYDPQYVNSNRYAYAPAMTHIADDIYAMDISSIDRDDLSIFFTQYQGTNSGEIYYIGISTKTLSQVQDNYSFVTS